MCGPRRRIVAGISIPISENDPWQKAILFEGDFTISTSFSKPTTSCMIRSLPSSSGSGGSSGCIAMTTPAFSATGIISSRKFCRFFHNSVRLAPGSRSARNAGRPGIRALSRSANRKAVTFEPPRSGASTDVLIQSVPAMKL